MTTTIAMVVSNPHDPDPRVQKEAEALVAGGYRVIVYGYDRLGDREPARERLGGVEIRRLRARRAPYGELWSTWRGLQSFHAAVRRELLRDPPDVVHCHDHDTCTLGRWWQHRASPRGRRGLFVFDAHDLYWTWLRMANPRSTWRRAGAWTLQRRDRAYARAADLLLAPTEAVGPHAGVAEVYRAWGCDPVVLWNTSLASDAAVPRLPSRFTVGYVGTVREPLMFERLVLAIEQLTPDERPAVLLAGGGTRRAQVGAGLERAATRLGFPLETVASFTAAELPGLIARTSVQYCVYPAGRGNIDRALPVKLFDSVARHRPVIGNADTLMGDWIERHGWGWTVAEDDVAALAQALRVARASLPHGGEPRPLPPPPPWQEQAERLRAAYARMLEREPLPL